MSHEHVGHEHVDFQRFFLVRGSFVRAIMLDFMLLVVGLLTADDSALLLKVSPFKRLLSNLSSPVTV